MKQNDNHFEVKSGPWYSTLIYFGRNMSTGGEVSEDQFADFLSTRVTPYFPMGLTVYDAYGQMQRQNGEIVKQKTKVVVLVYGNAAADEESIKKIIADYRQMFAKPQVMLIAKQVNPQFYGD